MRRTTKSGSFLVGYPQSKNLGGRPPLIERLENRQLLSVSLKTPSVAPPPPTPPIVVDPITPVTPVGPVVPVIGVGITFNAIAGTQYSGEVGILRGLSIVLPQPGPLGYMASIDWGDGTTPSAGTFVPSPSASAVAQVLVDGSHTYAANGTYNVIVTVTNGPLPGSGSLAPVTLVATIDSTAIVGPVVNPTPPPVTGTGVTINPKANELFTGTVGLVKGWVPPPTTTGALRLTELTASINWGDNTPLSGGVLVNIGGGNWDVNGSHTYASTGKFNIVVKVYQQSVPIAQPQVVPVGPIPFPPPLPSPTGTLLVTIDSTAEVTPGNGTGVTLNEVVDKPFTANLGTFAYLATTAAPKRILSATINWGDGSVSTGKIVALPGKPGEFSVFGTHTYNKTGKFIATITVLASPVPIPLNSAVTPIPPIGVVIAEWLSTINVAAA